MQTLKVYTTPPQMEHKGRQEAIGKAHVPTEPRTYKRGSKSYTKRVPSARGYVFAEGKPAEAKYLRALPIPGKPVTPRDLLGLYVRSSKTQRRHAYNTGDKVIRKMEKADVPGVIAAVHGGGWYEVAFDLIGKRCLVKLQETDISHHTHPHIK